jgi:hypothetical protein
MRTAGRIRPRNEAPREPAPPAASAGPSLPAAPTASAARPEVNDSLPEEVNMLRDARAALDRGDARRALAILDAHEARFSRGTLYEERLASRVQALCASGQTDAARRAAEELERAAPRSPHLTRVRASCVAPPSSK